jgi:predicted metal-dependent peptidase
MDIKAAPEKKISRTIVDLQQDKPFFAYLIMKLRITEETGQLPNYAMGGVNARGELLYRKSFVQGLTFSQLSFFLIHEVLHVALSHLTRNRNKDPQIWNIACDIVVNDIACANGYQTIPDSVPCSYDHCIDFQGIKIEDIDKKSAEQIYAELIKGGAKAPKTRMDMHMEGDGDEKLSESEAKELRDKWEEAMVTAATHAQMRGKTTQGMDAILRQLIRPKLCWKALLRKYVTESIIHDYSYSKYNKKNNGDLFPGIVKESIDIVIHVDTSGSIGDDSLQKFLSEIVAISRAHQNVNMNLIVCDCEIQDVYKVNATNKNKILNLKFRGRGGTSHQPVFDHIAKKIPRCKLLVSFTDGYSDINECKKPGYNVIWILKNGKGEQIKYGRKIILED